LKTDQEVESPIAYLAVNCILQKFYFLVKYIKDRRKSAIDIAFITFLFLGIWESAYKLGFTHPVLVPAPENVFYVFIEQKELMLAGVVSSLVLLAWGVGLAVILGVFLGLFTGWIPRLREAVVPIANVISPIPPLVYTPYVVAVMPTFKIASIFVIFSAVFWPTFSDDDRQSQWDGSEDHSVGEGYERIDSEDAFSGHSSLYVTGYYWRTSGNT